MKENNIILEPPSKSSLTHIVKWKNDDWLGSIVFDKKKTTVHDESKWIEDISKSTTEKIVVARQGSIFLGLVYIYNIDLISRNAYFATVANDNEDERSIITQMIKHSFNTINLNKISIDIDSISEQRVGIYKSLGFKTEVKKRQHLFKNGKYHTVLEMSLFREN